MIKNVMIVDDDPGVRYTVKTGIEMLDENYHIKSVDGGIKCLEILKTRTKRLTIDIIIRFFA